MIRIVHPRAHLLAPAPTLYTDVISGRWGAVAHLVQSQLDCLQDAEACADDLDAVLAAFGYVTEDAQPYTSFLDGEDLIIEATSAQVATTIDLFIRVLIGQWRQIDWVTRWECVSLGEKDTMNVGAEVDLVRLKHQRPGAYPDFAGSSWGVYSAESGDAARLGYSVWKAMGEGVRDRPTPAFEGQLPTVIQSVDA